MVVFLQSFERPGFGVPEMCLDSYSQQLVQSASHVALATDWQDLLYGAGSGLEECCGQKLPVDNHVVVAVDVVVADVVVVAVVVVVVVVVATLGNVDDIGAAVADAVVHLVDPDDVALGVVAVVGVPDLTAADAVVHLVAPDDVALGVVAVVGVPDLTAADAVVHLVAPDDVALGVVAVVGVPDLIQAAADAVVHLVAPDDVALGVVAAAVADDVVFLHLCSV